MSVPINPELEQHPRLTIVGPVTLVLPSGFTVAYCSSDGQAVLLIEPIKDAIDKPDYVIE